VHQTIITNNAQGSGHATLFCNVIKDLEKDKDALTWVLSELSQRRDIEWNLDFGE
jgi:hypothetical protein